MTIDLYKDALIPEPELAQLLADQLKRYFKPEEIAEVQAKYLDKGWPEEYINRDTNKPYKPHHLMEARFVLSDTPAIAAVLGGEGSGKTCSTIIKDLERLRRGCSGLMVSPDFEHFRRSIWPEFRRWCPWDRVDERQRYRESTAWEPQKPFTITFNSDVGTQATLMCGGCIETDLKSWEGPNVNFAHLDEMRRHKTPIAMKTLLGRVRIPGPNGEPPQLYLSTTPSKHWLYEYFGPLPCVCQDCHAEYAWELVLNTVPTCPSCGSTHYTTDDLWHDFKRKAAVVRLRTQENEENLYTGFAQDRALSLSEAEARVLLDAEWEDLTEAENFLPSMTLWDLCYSKDIPPLTDRDPIVLAIDAAKGRTASYSDCFAIVGVSRHWEPALRRNTCVVRFVLTWQARPGQRIDFVGTPDNPGPELMIRDISHKYDVVQVAYDPYELHDFGMRLSRDRVAWLKEFSQLSDRTEADSDLLQLILSRRIVHDGNQTLRSHIANADRKVSDDGHKFRIVKRLDQLKVDAAVALSMACYRCLHLNIA